MLSFFLLECPRQDVRGRKRLRHSLFLWVSFTHSRRLTSHILMVMAVVLVAVLEVIG